MYNAKPSLKNISNDITINKRESAYIVEIDLSVIDGVYIDPSNILVTVLNETKEVEVSFMPKPMGIDTTDYVYDFLYKNKSLSKLPDYLYNEIVKKLRSGDIDYSELSCKRLELKYLKTSYNESSIIVFIDPSTKESITNYTDWYYKALSYGLNKRAKFKYKSFIIYVYFSDKGKIVNPSVLIPDSSPNSIIKVKIYNAVNGNCNRLVFNSRQILDTRNLLSILNKSVKADFEGIEVYSVSYSISQYDDIGGFLWYIRPWSSEDPKNGDLGLFRNCTLTGSTSYSIFDKFSYRYNTTRYEVWIWLSTNEATMLYIKLYLDNNQVLNEPLDMEPGILYGYGIIVHTSPEEPGNYLQPAPKDVNVLLKLDYVLVPDAKISVNGIAIARAYIEPINERNGVYNVYNYLKGIGDMTTSSDDNNIDDRYHFVYSGEAVFTFLSINNLFELLSYPYYYYPYLYIRIKSDPSQKYDRYVSLYINGKLLSRKLAYNPDIPNGTSGVRSAFFYLSGSSTIFQEILSSLKKGVGPTIKIVIEGFEKPPYCCDLPRDSWFIEYGVLSYLSRSICTSDLLYHEDPTKIYDGSCAYIASLKYRYFHGVQLWSELTDIKQQQLLFSYYPPITNSYSRSEIALDIKHTARYVFNEIYPYSNQANSLVNYIYISLDIWAPRKISLEAYKAWGLPSNSTKEALETIQRNLWIISVSGSMFSYVSGNWILTTVILASTVLSSPSLYVYGNVLQSNCMPYGQGRGLRCNAVLDLGWNWVEKTIVTYKVVICPINPWSIDDYVMIDYKVKMFVENWNTLGTYDTYRKGWLQLSNTVKIYPVK